MYYHGAKEKPVLRLSDNIRLKQVSTYTQHNYTSVNNTIEFKDPEKENREKLYRFSVSYSFTRADFFPSALGNANSTIFNMKFVRGLPEGSPVHPYYRAQGIYTLKGPSQSLVVVPRFRFDPPSDYFDMAAQYFMNVTSGNEFKELSPDELFGLFSLEKGTPDITGLPGGSIAPPQFHHH